jgi:hypothetical protein
MPSSIRRSLIRGVAADGSDEENLEIARRQLRTISARSLI